MKKAFTIVELLVVMAVIGILITLAVVGIQALQKSQRETTRLNDLKNFNATLASYYSKYRAYPLATTTKHDDVFSATLTDNLTVVGGTAPTVTFTEVGSVTATNFIVPISSLGMKIHSFSDWGANGVNVGCVSTGAEGDDNLVATADQWYIEYRTGTGLPQSYTLAACTENGWSGNQGTKVD